jgi:hypothetical protein
MGYKQEREHVTTGLSAHGWTCRICWFLGVMFAVLGVIAAAANIALGLGPTNWLLLAIAAFAAGITNCIAFAAGLNIYAIEAKSKKGG